MRTVRIDGAKVVWLCVAAISVLWFGWVARGGLGHIYYSASARTLASNPKWLLSGAFDPGGYVTVDKPPLGLWPTALGAAVGGKSAVALVLPGAILAWLAAIFAGWTAPRTARPVAVLLILLTPGFGVLARSTLPDATMLAAGCAAAWIALRSDDDRRFALVGVLLGIALLAKPGAVLMIPAFLVVAVWEKQRRVRMLVSMVVPLLLVLLTWSVLAQLTPDRPYFGGTNGDTALEQIVGPATASRVIDADLTSGDRWIGLASAGEPGPFRTVTGRMGLQSGYLLALALVLGFATVGGAPRAERKQMVFWLVWLVSHAVVYSALPGIAHAYYAASLAPPTAVLVVGLARRAKSDWLTTVVLAVTVLMTVGLARSTPVVNTDLAVGLLVVGVVVGTTYGLKRMSENPAFIGVVAGVVLVMALISAHQLTVDRTWSFDPAAGDLIRTRELSKFEGEELLDPAALADWVLVTDDEVIASRLIADEQLRVMLVGGFLSRDPIIERSELRSLVRAGEVGFVHSPTDVESPAGELVADVYEGCAPVAPELRRCP